MAYTLKFSDGTTTFDFYGSNYVVLDEGLSIPPVEKDISRGDSSKDGEIISNIFYRNRTITINFKIVGSSVANVVTLIEALEAALNDAEERCVSGYGTKYYLEYQWGNTAGASRYFDVLQGKLQLPDDFYGCLLTDKYTLTDCKLILECKPFARKANEDIKQATVLNYDPNYVDVDSGLLWNGSFEIADPPTGWTLTGAAATVARSTTQKKIGSYSALLTRNGANAYLYQNLGTVYNGKTITFGCWVWASVANRARIYIDDGVSSVSSINHTGGSGWEWLTVTQTIDASAALCYFVCTVFDGNTAAYFDGAIVLLGSTINETPDDSWLGDFPAKAYIKINPSGATGTKNIYVAKRSGTRYNDDLWTEGEDETSVTDITSEATLSNSDVVDAACSAGKHKRVSMIMTAVDKPDAGDLLSRINFTLATPPLGLFRVLARCRVNSGGTPAFGDLAWGLGYSYGNLTKTPSKASGEFIRHSALNTWELLDLGLLTIPPASKSEIATNSALELRIFQCAYNNLANVLPTSNSVVNLNNPTNAYDADWATYAGFTGSGTATSTFTGSHADIYCSGILHKCSGGNAGFTVEANYGGWNTIHTGAGAAPGAEHYDAIGSDQNVTDLRISIVTNAASIDHKVYEAEFVCPVTFDLDYIFLLPADEGYAVINSGNTDIIALDGISQNPKIYIIDGSSKILQVASAVGAPFSIGRETTRIYILRDDLPSVTFAVDTKFQKLFKTI